MMKEHKNYQKLNVSSHRIFILNNFKPLQTHRMMFGRTVKPFYARPTGIFFKITDSFKAALPVACFAVSLCAALALCMSRLE